MPESTRNKQTKSEMHPYPSRTCEFIKDSETFQWVLEAAVGKSKVEKEKLCEFLQSTMDEPRLRRAGELSLAILLDDRLETARHFRRGVVRRELSGEVSFPKQRDHDAHTLNNYILGFWFFEKVPAIKQEFAEHAKSRGLLRVEDSSRNTEDPRVLAGVFGRLWKYVSLLHDVGYLFEGGLKELDPETQSRHARLGANIVSDFFEATFWRECEKMSSTDARKRLMSMADVAPPTIDGSGIQALIDSMRRLGDLSNLTADSVILHELPSDAFDLWEKHYQDYPNRGRPKNPMVERIVKLERITYKLIESGLPDNGIRVLDHAVMSGLLQLLWRTTFLRLYQGVRRASSQANPLDENARKEFLEALEERPDLYRSEIWWGGVVWASAATALHNIQQMKPDKLASAFGNFYQLDRLALADDPLAYLGILVDILQDWDRYRVNPNLRSQGPIEGHRVRIGTADGHILLEYPHDRERTIEEELSRSLEGWHQFVAFPK